MDEYIEREALVVRLQEHHRFLVDAWGDFCSMPMQDKARVDELSNCIAEVFNAPAADVAPVAWMPVLGFEGLYEVSGLGQVRNQKGEILKQGIKRTPCTCYKVVHLWKDGVYYTKYVHRLIAEAFIPNPDNLPMVNHKDEDGTNNLICNLEWCTREYNVNYGTAKERRAKKIRGRESEKRKPVLQYDLGGNIVARHNSVADAANSVGCSTHDISRVCLGKRKTARGFVWKHDTARMDGE